MMITVGLPFYNQAATLADAIRSVLAQTHTDWQLLLVDDASTDGAYQWVAKIRDPRIKLIRHPRNLGLAATLNEIATLAQGTWLARMDADDMMLPERLRQQLTYLNDHPQVDVLGCAAYCIDQHNQPTGILRPPRQITKPRQILSANPLLHPTVVARCQWFRDHRYRESLRRSQDYELWLRTFPENTMVSMAQPLMCYRFQPSLTWKKFCEHGRMRRAAVREYGPAMVGRMTTERIVLERHLKSCAAAGLAACGLWQWALTRKQEPVDETTKDWLASIVSHIRQTPLPGLPDQDI